ncbi:hypothetical protein BH11PSE11_BH11PSE11_21740 [soil metagenome]
MAVSMTTTVEESTRASKKKSRVIAFDDNTQGKNS